MADFETGGTPEPETGGKAPPRDRERRLWLFGALGFVGLVVLVALALAVAGAVFGIGQTAGQEDPDYTGVVVLFGFIACEHAYTVIAALRDLRD